MFCGNETTYEILTLAAKKQMLAHAILLCGPARIGKTTLGKAIAKSVFCAKEPFDDDCKSCRQIEKGEFPDFWFSDNPDVWKLEQVYDLQNFLNTSGFTGKFKVALLPSVNLLTEEAGNALLKTLEEPPDNRLIIFTAEKRENLMPTIASRTSPYFLNPVADTKIEEFLKSLGANQDLSVRIARVALGRPGRAKMMLEDKNMLEQAEKIRDFLKNNQNTALFKIFALSEKISKKSEQDQRDFWEELLHSVDVALEQPIDKLLKFDVYKKSYVQSRLMWDNFLWEALG